jgi:hypothetical protein
MEVLIKVARREMERGDLRGLVLAWGHFAGVGVLWGEGDSERERGEKREDGLRLYAIAGLRF